ncbi:hypothetical protein [Burkholderia cenocepacia]|uniref:hypothetical protein n=1 Tax=Burkholderia cenocepacia TaxID=95486 RepID=UPI00158ABF55|nr:hypothetical protein [Burkholderia cenocepacia]
MIAKRLAVGAALLLASVGSHADITVGTFKKTDHTNFTLLSHIGGIGTGIEWANTALSVRGQQPLFCPPQKLATNAANNVSMLESFISAHQSKDDLPVGLILLQAYIETFPCT